MNGFLSTWNICFMQMCQAMQYCHMQHWQNKIFIKCRY
jgi:hypothetical protein